MDTSFTIRAPHEEAIALLKCKAPISMEVFKGLLPELRARAFAVTGVVGAGTLQRCRDAIVGVAAGDTWEDAKASLIDELEPFLGDGSEKRAETLLRTHAFQAFQTSVWRTSQKDDDTTHLQYLATEDDRVRDSHLALNGIVLPKDDPFWNRHYPPWEWGCRCSVRPMNEDDVADALTEDQKRNPEDRNVITGPVLQHLRNGTLIREGRRYNVSPPEGEDKLNWSPDDLRLPLSELKSRYDKPTWEAFESWARNMHVNPDLTVWKWLNGGQVEIPEAAPKPAAPAAVPELAVIEKLKAKGFKKPIVDAARKLPQSLKPFADTVKMSSDLPDGGAFYRPATQTVHMSTDLDSWSGQPCVFFHEFGHHVHSQSGLIGSQGPSEKVQRAVKSDLKQWSKAMKEKHGDEWKEKFKRSKFYLLKSTVLSEMGLSEDDTGDITLQGRIGRVADTIMGLTKGQLGMGHAPGYMKTHGAHEVFAHAFSSLFDGDVVYQKMFPNIIELLKKEFNL